MSKSLPPKERISGLWAQKPLASFPVPGNTCRQHASIFLYVTCVYTLSAYNPVVKALFVELPAFERHRARYLDDDAFQDLQNLLLSDPGAGDVIPGTGGLRKLRFAERGRGKGKRGGLRVIYYWWTAGLQFWLFTLFSKDDMTDLTPQQRTMFRGMIKAELAARRKW